MDLPTLISNLFIQGALAFVATLGFAVLFNVPRQTALAAGFIGAGGQVVRYSLRQAGVSPEVSTYLAALFVGVVGYWVSVRYKLPRLVFTVTGIIPMIPGVPAYEVIFFFTQGDVAGGLQSAVRAGLLTLAIAAGLATARILNDPDWAKIGESRR